MAAFFSTLAQSMWRHFFFTALLVIGLASFALPAQADQPEVREVARINNCPPKKIDVYLQSLGVEGQTVYQVQCNLPKTVGPAADGAATPDALLVGCNGNMCQMMRRLTLEKK